MNSIFQELFNDISYIMNFKKNSLTYTMFKVSDGNSSSQFFRKNYQKTVFEDFLNDID